MDVDSRSRKWQITINNPNDHGFTHDFIKSILVSFKSLIYWCVSDEVGEKGTYHTHLFVAFSNAVRFSTLQNKFCWTSSDLKKHYPHFEMSRGTSQENRDYVFKEGKWEKDKKRGTNLLDTHEEWGDLPVERQGTRNDIHDLYDMIKAGMDNYSILELNPDYMLHLDKIELARQIIKSENYKNVFRDLVVTYITGSTGTGKTRGVMEKYGYSNVYRITDYDHPFDSYKGQDVVVFEEFRSSLKIQDMLNYLDGYPLDLPCRYANKVACFTKVYIITNVDLSEQYVSVQENHLETWKAFLRRIHYLDIYNFDGSISNYNMSHYRGSIPLKKEEPVTDSSSNINSFPLPRQTTIL